MRDTGNQGGRLRTGVEANHVAPRASREGLSRYTQGDHAERGRESGAAGDGLHRPVADPLARPLHA